MRAHAPALALALTALLAPAAAFAATPVPAASAPPRVDITKIQDKKLLPKTKLHTEFVVEVNKKGQVSRVRSGKNSSDHGYNYLTYGNALQAFIRTPDGRSISGLYRLTYDYNPSTGRTRRDVQLIHAGGVNPNATGAATQLMAIAAKQHKEIPKPHIGTPLPTASADARRMPDLNGVIHSPAPK